MTSPDSGRAAPSSYALPWWQRSPSDWPCYLNDSWKTLSCDSSDIFELNGEAWSSCVPSLNLCPSGDLDNLGATDSTELTYLLRPRSGCCLILADGVKHSGEGH